MACSAGIRTGVLLLLTGGALAARGAGIGSCRLADHGLTVLEPSWGGTVTAAPRIAPARSPDTGMGSAGGPPALLRHGRVYGHRRHRRRLG